MTNVTTEPARILLAVNLDITAASPLARELLALRGRDLLIDASRVERVGAQCLQVLLSAAATWNADMVPIDLERESDAFRHGIAVLGISKSRLINEELHR